MQIEQDINAIIEPSEVSFWPLQPGWYIIFCLLVIVLLFILRGQYKKWLRNTFKREAIAQIASLPNSINFFYDLNTVLKSVAIQTKGRADVASMSGKDWSHFLNTSKKNTIFTSNVLEGIERSNYNKQHNLFDEVLIEQAKKQAILWISSRFK